jgi:2-polyprenyl-3-methyl-5-hydroxy-6-metoxy-1,4-benzoquinol methylase
LYSQNEKKVEVLELKEEQYKLLFEVIESTGLNKFGPMVNQSWQQDPKRLLFTLARYKFVSKVLEGSERVLEIGCADAFGTRLVQQTTGEVTATDFDPIFIDDVNERMNPEWKMKTKVHDFLVSGLPESFDGVFCLDVLEHIEMSQEETFMRHVTDSLGENGVFVAGMPSLESQKYASPQSLAGHVNCKAGDDLKKLMKEHFHNVFIFSMNDEVVHTGFKPMAQYLLAVCCSKRSKDIAQ